MICTPLIRVHHAALLKISRAACHMPDQSRAVLYQLSKPLSPDAGICFIDSSHGPNNGISMLCLLVYNQKMSAYIAHSYSNVVETKGLISGCKAVRPS